MLFLAIPAGAIPVAQSAKLFVSEAQGGVSTQVFRYEVGPTGIPTLDLIITDPSFDAPCCLAFSRTGEMFVVNRKPDPISLDTRLTKAMMGAKEVGHGREANEARTDER